MSIALLIAYNRSHTGCILEPPQRPKVVPIGVYGGGIALVADRLRHDSIERLLLWGFKALGQALLAQGVDVLDGLDGLGPHPVEQPHIPGMTIVLHQQVNELAMTIVLG